MPNPQLQEVNQMVKKQQSCVEIWEDHAMDIGNRIETGKFRIWYKLPPLVYTELPSPMILWKDSHWTVLFFSLCTPMATHNIAISTIWNDPHTG